jgi:hypothetical protein
MKKLISTFLVIIFASLFTPVEAQQDYDNLIEWLPNQTIFGLRFYRLQERAEQKSWLMIQASEKGSEYYIEEDTVAKQLDQISPFKLSAEYIEYDRQQLYKLLRPKPSDGQKPKLDQKEKKVARRLRCEVYETFDTELLIINLTAKGLLEDSGKAHRGAKIYKIYDVQPFRDRKERYLLAADGIYTLVADSPELLADMYDSGSGVFENYTFHKDFKQVEKLLNFNNDHQVLIVAWYHNFVMQIKARGEEVNDASLLRAANRSMIYFFTRHGFLYGDKTRSSEISVYPNSLIDKGFNEKEERMKTALERNDKQSIERLQLHDRHFKTTKEDNWVVSICEDDEAYHEEYMAVVAKYNDAASVQGISEEERAAAAKRRKEILDNAKKKKQ